MDGIILKAFVDRKRLNKTKLATALGMSKQNLYQLFESKEFKPETVRSLENHFKTKWTRVKSEVNIDVPRETKREKPPEITQDRYLKLLEDNDKFFKNLIKTNLGTAEVVQAAILAHLKAMVQADAEEKSGGDKRKQERMLSAWNRRIAENLGLLEKKDSYSTVDR